VIDRAGADALRFAFLSLITGQGQDVKLSEDKITEARNFANKIWNVSRFVLMGVAGRELRVAGQELELADKWILSRLNQTIKQVTGNIDAYEFGEAANALYGFIWSEFCDWYVEIAKIRLYGQDEKAKAVVQTVLLTVMRGTLKILHPFMPFITEEIWSRIAGSESRAKTIMLEKWPETDERSIDAKLEAEMAIIMEVIRAVRNIRAEFNVPHGNEVEVTLVGEQAINETYLKTLAKVGKITTVKKLDKKPAQTASAVAGGLQIYVALAGLIDLEKETARLTKDKEKLEQELVKIRNRLADANFLAKALPESVAKEKQKEADFSAKIKLLAERLSSLY
jgi:valyl-tRNA synthetase